MKLYVAAFGMFGSMLGIFVSLLYAYMFAMSKEQMAFAALSLAVSCAIGLIASAKLETMENSNGQTRSY